MPNPASGTAIAAPMKAPMPTIAFTMKLRRDTF
jgi:hypothetical protein